MATFTQDQYLDKCRSIHGDRYDYSKTVYTGISNKITVTCPIHGDFNIGSSHHTNRCQGCPKCSHKKARTPQQDFLKRVTEIHKTKYDFSESIYIKSNVKVTVNCHKHGDFQISPQALLRGKGCIRCFHDRQHISTEEFIDRAKEMHGEKYDYSQTIFIDSATKVNINCLIHGKFNQNPTNHVKGHGCPFCRNDGISARKTKSNEDYVREATIAHNGKYSYSNTNYVANGKKIIVTCPIHGDFEINSHNHLYGLHGCKKCNSSYGETAVINILNELSIKYNIQAVFDECKYKRLLPFDFQVFKNNDEFFLIEVDGEQHKHPVKFNGISTDKAIDKFNTVLKRDQIKNEWATQNSIKLYRVDYEWNKLPQLKQDIYSILGKEF